MTERSYWVYILVSASGNAMYIGVTNNLENRLHEHRSGKGSEFAKKYRAGKLVHAEEYDNPTDAIAREKQLKGWRRERKNALVRATNPQFRELLSARHWPTPAEVQALGEMSRPERSEGPEGSTEGRVATPGPSLRSGRHES